MPADVAQEVDVVERVQPVGVVGHDGVARPSPNFRNFAKIARMPLRFSLIMLVGQNLAALVLAGRIADARGAAAHQRDRAMAGLLHPVQHHDRQQRADMQRGRGAVEADIGGDRPDVRASASSASGSET